MNETHNTANNMQHEETVCKPNARHLTIKTRQMLQKLHMQCKKPWEKLQRETFTNTPTAGKTITCHTKCTTIVRTHGCRHVLCSKNNQTT